MGVKEGAKIKNNFSAVSAGSICNKFLNKIYLHIGKKLSYSFKSNILLCIFYVLRGKQPSSAILYRGSPERACKL
jgi:hypothetical protein